MYAFRVLHTHTHDLPSVSLQDVFRTTILAKIQYCSPAWSGYCSAADRTRLDGFLKRCKWRGFCENELPSVTQIFDDADNIFFAGILRNNQHVLQTFLPDRTLLQYQLRQRSHNRSWYLKQLIWTTVTLLFVCCIRTVINFFLNFYCFTTFFSTVVLFIVVLYDRYYWYFENVENIKKYHSYSYSFISVDIRNWTDAV